MNRSLIAATTTLLLSLGIAGSCVAYKQNRWISRDNSITIEGRVIDENMYWNDGENLHNPSLLNLNVQRRGYTIKSDSGEFYLALTPSPKADPLNVGYKGQFSLGTHLRNKVEEVYHNGKLTPTKISVRPLFEYDLE